MLEGLHDEDRSRDLIKSLEKGIAVLRIFSESRGPMTMARIAEKAGLSRPAVRRILLTLEHIGYAYQHGGQWGLTPRVLEIGAGYFSKSSLPEIAAPYLQIVVDRISETCHVGVWDRHEVVHVARVEVPRVVPDSIHIGTRLPAYATAIGLVLLAGLNEMELAEYFSSTDRVRLTPETVIEEAPLRARIDAVRDAGFAITQGELALGTSGVAVPLTVQGKVVGALGVTSNPLRHSANDLVTTIVPILLEVGADISQSYELSRRRRLD